ncbi:hypothetical protein [Tsukamurella ocularis]|uniref:hypothetical protein n=1 Tax=Tsukamurella ocularis TaxID=1970234 RepID=UPI002169B2ED|nr:hypothetical protein [Tsukamurella ocularis]MCS3779354.1 hypothetical protein [Tsukamurella ocularis]MCS3789916.1 hypothetical protein [Tsukamurella ocularis]
MATQAPNITRTSPQIDDPRRVLPTLPGMVSGIVATGTDERGKTTATVQCATCLRTATDIVILAVNWADFGGDGDRSSAYNPRGPRRPYRRCAECQLAARHPEQVKVENEMADQNNANE